MYKESSYIEHFLHDHKFVFHDYIEIVLDNMIQDQYHDSNHDKLSNHMDLVSATIDSEDILRMILEHLMMEKLYFEILANYLE
jgi:hypothetical protein